jgi:hypothetical protein
VGEPLVVEDPERESKGFVVVRLHKVHRKAWRFHYKVMWRGDHWCLEEVDVCGVLVAVH